MKTQLIFKKVQFICDKCNKVTEYFEEGDSADFKGGHVFPYNAGWIYVYKMIFKVLGCRFRIEDKHFCCKQCFDLYTDNLSEADRKKVVE